MTLRLVAHALPIQVFGRFSWIGFWWYVQQSAEFLYVWPMLLLSLALVANLVLALIYRWPFHTGRWRREYWLVFLSVLFVPITIAIGLVGAVDPSPMHRPKPNPLAVWSSNGLFITSIMLGVFCVYRMKGLRWFASAVVLIELWVLLAAGLIAGMALSGDWL